MTTNRDNEWAKNSYWQNYMWPYLERVAMEVLRKLENQGKATLEDVFMWLSMEGLPYGNLSLYWIWEVMANAVPPRKALVIRPEIIAKDPEHIEVCDIEVRLVNAGEYRAYHGEKRA